MDELNEQVIAATQLVSDNLRSGQDTAFQDNFNALHDYEKGQVYANLAPDLRPIAWRLLSIEDLGIVFDNIDADIDDILALLLEMPPKRAAQVLQNMYADNEADILQAMNERQLAAYLNLLPKAEATEMRQLLDYDDKTAGALMSTDFVTVHETLTIGEVMRWVKKQAEEAESINYIYVLDQQERLVGVLSLRDLITHPDSQLILDITNTRVISVAAADDQQDVIKLMADYNFLALPVVDDNQHLLGVITVDDIVDAMDEEAVADYSGLAAVNVSDVNDSPWHSAIKRIPWLVALLVLGMGTATLIDHFDALVKQASILAVFISLVTGTAGNAGTQAIALAVRRLAVSEDTKISRVIVSEVITGLMVGLVTGLTILVMIGLWKQDWILGLIVGGAMGIAIVVANLAGNLIPIFIDKIGLDPAVASGPFITTLSDLTSVLIYFSIAQVFISHFVGG
jgi:magnesium transporter